MRAVVQRVQRAEVTVEGSSVGRIDKGLCVFVGVMVGDQERDVLALAKKVAQLRIFEDSEGKMNASVADVGGAVLAVSQFTLAGDARKGNRPSFISAMEPSLAREFFEQFCQEVRKLGLSVATGKFRAHMEVSLVNDGPVTILLDTQKSF
jgi:D-tyrosyl-tRNA(Tyr) deacylase